MDDETAPAGDIAREPARRRRDWRQGAPLAGCVAVAVAGLVCGSLALSGGFQEAGRTVLASSSTRALRPGATISVTGSGTVQGVPNEVSFTIGVQTTADTATGALAANDSDLNTLEASLRHAGVTPADMQTSSLNIWDNTNSSGEITGFTVNDDLNVTMKHVATAGSAIDAAAGSVGNAIQLQGISFSISNDSRLLARARAVAMLNARAEASQLAAGAGLSLGPIVKVTDEENSNSAIIYPENTFGEAASVPTHLEAGTQPLTVNVAVVYELRS